MKIRTALFLDQFDTGFKTHIVEFAKRLTDLSKKYDVLIFLARKAACLADCFDELSLTNFHCVITSSRILDMDLEWLRHKKIAIIDDALISGTTLYQALRKLETSGITNVDVSVLSIDSYWWNKDFVNPIKPYFELTSEQTSQLCANIVQAISVVPRPYTIDYPLYKNIRILSTDFHELSNSANWIVYEATSSHQDKYNIVNLTIIPVEETLISILAAVGLPADPRLMMKLRFYALKIGNIYWCQLLPIVILPPMKVETVDILFNHLIKESGNTALTSWFVSQDENDAITGKLRLIQYYIAAKLGNMWHDQMIKKVDSNIILEQDFKNINLLFPPPISDTIKNLSAKNDSPTFANLKISYSTNQPGSPHLVEPEFDEIQALHRLSTPFLKRYTEKEIEARQRAKELGPAVFKDARYQSLMARLNEGFSLNDLKQFISSIPRYINKGRLVSYFLDLYIDKGVVVPITFVKDGIIFRAFRHGEDVEFSQNELRLCMAMLTKFAKEYGANKLPHTIVEKLLVLFVRIGIQKKFLSVSTAPLSDFQSIGIRYYLHGAVVGSFDKTIYKMNAQYSLTNLLTETGYLERAEFKDEYTVHEAPTSGVDNIGLSEANLIGSVFGHLMKQSKPKITIEELILIATIPSLVDAVGALAAEIYIFQNFYYYENEKFFPKYSDNRIVKFRAIRKKNAFTALNSGTWKYENFKLDSAWSIIKNAKAKFDQDVYADVWNSFWPSMGKETGNTSTSPELLKLLEQLADWLFTTRFYINLIEISLTKSREEFRREPPLGEMQSMLNIVKNHNQALYVHLARLHDRTKEQFLEDTLKREALYNYCTSKLKENFQFARQLLSEVDSIATNFGKIDRVAFCEHIVVIDFKKFSQPRNIVKNI